MNNKDTDIYSDDERAQMLDTGEIDTEEEGFMIGYCS